MQKFRYGRDYRGQHALETDELRQYGDRPLSLRVISESRKAFICEPSDAFWSHWNGTNRKVLKRLGVRLLKERRAEFGDEEVWIVILSKRRVSNGS